MPFSSNGLYFFKSFLLKTGYLATEEVLDQSMVSDSLDSYFFKAIELIENEIYNAKLFDIIDSNTFKGNDSKVFQVAIDKWESEKLNIQISNILENAKTSYREMKSEKKLLKVEIIIL